MQSPSLTTFRRLAGALFIAALMVAPLRPAQETELKDEAGKTILKYVIEERIVTFVTPPATRSATAPWS